MFDINNGIDINNTTVAAALTALSTQKGIEGWWTRTCSVDVKHASYAFPRGDGTQKLMAFDVKRFAADGIDLVCTSHVQNPDWLGTKLSFAAKATSSGVRVSLVHAGYPSRNECYDDCVKGWAFFLGSLKEYLETGVGKPFGSGHMGEQKAA